MLIQPLLTRLDELSKLSTQGEWHVTKIDFTTRKGEIGKSCWPSNDLQFTEELHNAYPTLRAEIERLQEVERKYEEIRKSV